MSKAPTSHDVARLAKVSQSAVSRAFTAGASVSPEMRERIMAAARVLGYRPNRLPGMMLSGKTGMIAIVAGGLYNPFHTMALEAFLKATSARGKKAFVVQVDSDRALDATVDDLAGYRIDGIVSSLSVGTPEIAGALAAYRIPVVTLNSELTNDYVHAVNSDHAAAGAMAARLLVKHGGRRFAFVGGPGHHVAHRLRGQGFADTLQAMGLDAPLMRKGDYTYRCGYELGRALTQGPARADAVFCTNDLMACGIMDAARRDAGLRCPQDILLIGHDNTPAADWASYDLTTFDQRLDLLADCALRLIEHAGIAPDPAPVMPLLIERGSTLRD